MTSLPRGVYRQRKRLADGGEAVYYRWRATGARIEGEPGTEEFERNLARVASAPPPTKEGSWGALVALYKRSPNYRTLGPKTRLYYDRQLDRVRAWAPKPVTEIRRTDVLTIRDALAIDTPQAANQFAMVISVLLDFAVEREFREVNPLLKLRRLPGGSHETWTEDQVRYALGKLAERFRRAIILGLYTGQREGDCCTMTWADYDGTAVRVKQEKTGEQLWIPAHRELKRELDAWKATAGVAPTILVNSLGRPWPVHSFAVMISRKLHDHAPLAGLVFHGIRKVAAARLAEAGCSTHEIAAITGHRTLAMVELYTRKANQRRRAVNAIRKLELVKDEGTC